MKTLYVSGTGSQTEKSPRQTGDIPGASRGGVGNPAADATALGARQGDPSRVRTHGSNGKAGRDTLRVKRQHSRTLTRCADLLEVDPQTFINWCLNDLCQRLTENGGLLLDWADTLLAYDSEEGRVRVMDNVQPLRLDGGGFAVAVKGGGK